MIPVYFDGPSVLVKTIERMDIGDDIEMSEKRVEPDIITNEEGATTAISFSAPTCYLIGESTIPHHPIASFIRLLHDFLQWLMEWQVEVSTRLTDAKLNLPIVCIDPTLGLDYSREC